MPSIGPRVHELRIRDEAANWRVVYRIDVDVILIVEIFEKTTRGTPRRIVDLCQKRPRGRDAWEGRGRTIDEKRRAER
jgi:phage-related protein